MIFVTERIQFDVFFKCGLVRPPGSLGVPQFTTPTHLGTNFLTIVKSEIELHLRKLRKNRFLDMSVGPTLNGRKRTLEEIHVRELICNVELG